MLENTTIFIPTHNRSKYLKRILDYYSSFNIKNIVVCDSSSRKYNQINNANIKYYHYKNYSYNNKIKECLINVKSKYVVFCADDDFIIPSAIIKCEDFLDKNRDYVSVQGKYISFIKKKNKIIYKPMYLKQIDKKIDLNKPTLRIEQLFSPYMHLCYSVHRTNILKYIFNLSYNKVKNLALIELFFAIISVINGKHMILPIFYSAREEIAGSSGRTTPLIFYSAREEIAGSSERTTPENNRLVLDKKYENEYNIFRNLIINEIVKNEIVSHTLAEKILDEVINNIYKVIINGERSKFEKVINKVKMYFPKLVVKEIGIAYMFISRTWDIIATKKMKGYPFFEKIAKNELKEIDYFIKRHSH